MSGASVADALEATGTDSVAAAAATQGLSRTISVRELLLSIRPMGFVWRGFRHGWQYNHRLNRFASYVRPARQDEAHDGWFSGHAAASGTGDDIVDYKDYYTGVSAPGVGFAAGSVVLPIDTTKTTPATVSQEVAVDANTTYLDREQYAVLLNGFDVVSAGDANKLMSLDLRVSEPSVRDDGCLTFDLICEFTGDCGTPECDAAPATDYMLVAHYLIVAGDPEDLAATRHPSSIEYRWDAEEELSGSVGDLSATAPDPGDGASGRRTAGFNRVAIDLKRGDEPPIFDVAASHGIRAHLDFWPLNRLIESAGVPVNGAAMHLLRWDTAVRSVDCEDDQCTVGLRLLFKNWRENMYEADFPNAQAAASVLRGHVQAVDPATLRDFKGDFGEIPSSLAALRDAGRARLEVGITLLHFQDHGFFAEQSNENRIYWPGGNRNAASEDAVQEHRLDDPID
jgi:hypothetical protein